MNAGCAGKTEIPWERVPYPSALEVCTRPGAIQIHVYLYLYLYQQTAVAHRPLSGLQEHFFVAFLLSSTKGHTFWCRLDVRAADDAADAVDRYWPIISVTASAVSSPRCRSISSWWTASSRSVVPCAHTVTLTSYHHRLPIVCSQHAVRK